jgi:transcriptional regulator with XRE-family HTH domain
MSIGRRSGITIDAERLDYEISRRGITQAELARRAGVPEPTLSHARHGRRVTNGTMRRLTTALLQIPLMVGADLLIVAPETRTAPTPTFAGAVQEVSRVSGPTSP